jgi:hypothetical protein
MKERVEKPTYETPKVVTFDKEKLSKLVGPVKGMPSV